MKQFWIRQLRTLFFQTGNQAWLGQARGQRETGRPQTRDPSSDRTASDQTSQTRLDSIGLGIRAQAGQPKPQTGHSSLNRTASDQTSKLRPDSLLQDIPIQIGSRQIQSERPGLGLNFLTQPSELRLNSLSSDIPTQSDQHRTDQTCHSRLDHLQQDTKAFQTGEPQTRYPNSVQKVSRLTSQLQPGSRAGHGSPEQTLCL